MTTSNTQEFLEALSNKFKVPILNNAETVIAVSGSNQGLHPLIIVIKGGNKQNEQGIFVHLKVALHLSQWLSPKFAVAVTDVLEAVIDGDFQALTPEAEKAQKELQKLWDELRNTTKETFFFLTDSIKEFYEINPRVESYSGQNYSEVFDRLNLGLFGKKAKTIKEELEISKGSLNRDHFGKKSLKKIEIVQRIAEPQIKKGETPVKAVEFALEVMNYNVSDYKD